MWAELQRQSCRLGNTEQSNVSEFRFSARQSRFSMLAQTQDFGGYKLETWLELDFLGAAPTANSNESNSYQPRMRNFYGRFVSDSGWYIMGGQNWSLVTLEKKGMDPRDEDAPVTIDAHSMSSGFSWNPQPLRSCASSTRLLIALGRFLHWRARRPPASSPPPASPPAASRARCP